VRALLPAALGADDAGIREVGSADQVSEREQEMPAQKDDGLTPCVHVCSARESL
jgi:hypothetical protein